MRTCGARRRTIRAHEMFPRSSLVATMTPRALATPASVKIAPFRQSPRTRCTPASRGSAGSGHGVDCHDRHPGRAQTVEDAPADAAETAQDDWSVHVAPQDGTSDGFRICGRPEQRLADTRTLCEPISDLRSPTRRPNRLDRGAWPATL